MDACQISRASIFSATDTAVFEKFCGPCGIVRPIAEFYIHGNGKPFSVCKSCHKAKSAKFIRENREKRASYAKAYRNRRTVEINNLTDEEINLFWSFVDKDGGPTHAIHGKCWIWTGSVLKDARGAFNVRGKTFAAYRVSFSLSSKMDISEICVLHKCDNPSCCRPEHLFAGTAIDNVVDMVQKNRQAKGSNHGLSKLNECDVKEIRQMIVEGKSRRTIAKHFVVSVSSINDICNGRTWAHVTLDSTPPKGEWFR